MRNLKRALSLALSSAMVLGMMVVGAGAVSYNDFTDKDEISNKDAVSMVTALGIINGLPNGSYGPTQNIDRASFVKMVCLTLNGGAEPVLPSSTKASYVDTAGTWAESYIEYCTNLGIAAGDGTTGKFNPTANVTISQAAKMLLVALGYNASIEGYVGLDWQMNVDVAANLAGLYKGISGSTSAPATRDQAAQMIYNALDATMVKYDSSFEVGSNGQVTARPQVNNDAKNGTLLENKFEAVKVVAEVVGNDYATVDGSSRTADGKTRVEIIEQPRSNVVTGEVADGVYNVASDPDMLGQSVTMFVRMSGGSTSASKATVLGNLILTEDNKIVTLSAKKDSANDVKDFLKGEGLKADGDTQYLTNYNETSALTNKAGEVIKYIDNDGDGVVDYALQTIKTFGKVDAYSSLSDGSIYVSAINPSQHIQDLVSSDVTVTNISNTDAAEEVNGFKDVAVDDYVFFYQLMGDELYVEKAEYVDVTVTAVRGDEITADGKTYKASGLIDKFGENNDKTLGAMVDLKDEVRLYLDAAGNVVYTDAVNDSTDYLYVLASDKYNNFRDTVEAKVVFADGTTGTIDIKAKDGDISLSNEERIPSNRSYTYSKNSKDVYTLYNGSNVVRTPLSDASVKKGQANIAGTGILANNSTIFVVKRGSSNSFSVYTGVNSVPSMDNVTGQISSENGIAKVVFITASNMSSGSEGIYVLDNNPYITSNGDDKLYTYDVIYKGEKTALTFDGSASPFTEGKGFYSDVEVVGTEIVAVNNASSTFVQKSEATRARNGIVANGQGTFTYNDDTVFLIADGLDVTTASVGAITADTTGSIDGSMIIIIPDVDNTSLAATVVICQ